MSRFGVADRTTAALSTTLPGASLFAPAGGDIRVREIGVFNTTEMTFAMTVRRLSTTGTRGAALTVFSYDQGSMPPLGTAYAAHPSGAPTIVAGTLRYGDMGGVVGAGHVWTFGENELVISAGGTNGIGLLLAAGTGRVIDFYIDWDE